MKKTKIIATIWPATDTKEQIIKMYQSWVNIVRFNFSHANHLYSQKVTQIIKSLNEEWITNLSLLLDTKWPEIRTWVVSSKLNFLAGDKVKIFTDENNLEEGSIFCDYPFLLDDIHIWDEIIIDSWLCKVKVLEKHPDFLLTQMLNSCELWSKRHINLPWVKLKFPGITKQDKEDILFAIKNNFDFIAASFIRNKENILEIRDFLKKNFAPHIKIISKIENQEAIENLEDIVKYSDGVMIARWDLWIEVPIEKLPYYQNKTASLCLENGKFFIIATHLLESMIENPFPTRAEVGDIYNSVQALSDCTMLSWETTTWKYPIDAIKMMNMVICEAEKDLQWNTFEFTNDGLNQREIEKKTLIKHSLSISRELDAKAIIILTKTWLLARIAAWFKSNTNIFAFTHQESTLKFMNILYGVSPFLLTNWSDNYLFNLDSAILQLKKQQFLFPGDKIIAITDFQKDLKECPIIKIVEIEDSELDL